MFFFFVLMGFRRYLNVRIVGSGRSQNLTDMTVPGRIRTLAPQPAINLLLQSPDFTLLLLYLKQIETDSTNKNDENRYFLHQKPTTQTKTTVSDISYIKNRRNQQNSTKKRRFLRRFCGIFSTVDKSVCIKNWSQKKNG